MKPETSIRSLPGIGEKRAQAFEKMGVYTIRDLLYHFPRAYQHRGNVRPLSQICDGEVASVLLTVAKDPVNVMVNGRMTLTKVSAFDESRRCTITFFNQGYLKDVLRVGATFRFYGKVSLKGGMCEMTSPAFEPYYAGRPLPEFFPVYPLSGPLSQKMVRDAVHTALEQCDLAGEDVIGAGLSASLCLLPLREALYAIHDPTDYAALDAGRNRFIFEELYLFATGVSMTRTKSSIGTAPRMTEPDMHDFYNALPFSFTAAQQRCAAQITSDLTNPDGRPMARLLSGDVGSGKTVVAALAAYICIKNGYQCALMAPTEILACQHYSDLKTLFDRFGIRTALLTGSISAAEKKKIYAALAQKEIDLLIGTHALFTDKVSFSSLGLVITDEQHRFGVIQRAALAEKGENPHVLVMSATPIPRTLSLILYGDLDLSEIDSLPPGRQKVSTFIINESYRSRLNGFIRKCVAEGGQVYIVCPAVESPEDEALVDIGYTQGERQPALKSAVEYAGALSALFPEARVRFLHGRMKGAEKEQAMAEFAAGKIDILVSTTVIEVGVNVPNASLMIVENAERFGLAQLHQLRGRVGRGTRKSYCILVSDSESETAQKRLAALKENENGYQIAKIDLEMRGPGDFFPSSDGTAKQHGAFSFRMAGLCGDVALLQSAFDAAAQTLKEDPALSNQENSALRRQISKFYTKSKKTLN